MLVDQSLMLLEVAMELALPHTFLENLAKRFGPEKARECAMSTSVGGIGPLLRERIFAQAEAGLSVVGVSLLYNTVWAQAWHEWGQINLQKRNVGNALRASLQKRSDLEFSLTFFDGKSLPVEVWECPYGKAVCYFLSAPGITEIVYPGPKDAPHGIQQNAHAWAHDIRLKQSWLVGRGALALSKKMNRKPHITLLSETPTFFSHHQLVKDEFQQDPFFEQTKYIFNDHTPLEYAHPLWDQGTIDLVKLDAGKYLNTPAWNGFKNLLDVTSLLVGTCDAVFGVAKKHGDVMKAMPSLKEFSSKIQYVTNGVRKEDWQALEFSNIEKLTDQDLLEVKGRLRKKLLDWVWRHCHLWPNWAEESKNRKIIAWTRRITPYKRLDLLVKMLKHHEWRSRFLNLNIVITVGGRIHQQDNHAQDIVYDLLDVLGKDPQLQSRIVTIDNFNVWEAPTLYQGVDGSIMLADDTREASATGFMKAQMNGGAILATADGAVPEFVFFQGQDPDPSRVNGFYIPYVNGEPTPLGLLEALEAFDKTMATPLSAAALVRASIHVTSQVGVDRTVTDMKKLYSSL
ncbi:MAG: hypothetical protein KCHDKBKB_02578 [Elusimicrobia bacterium]|nr:hypothetical protein [Elusimicrobiota bacterium]